MPVGGVIERAKTRESRGDGGQSKWMYASECTMRARQWRADGGACAHSRGGDATASTQAILNAPCSESRLCFSASPAASSPYTSTVDGACEVLPLGDCGPLLRSAPDAGFAPLWSRKRPFRGHVMRDLDHDYIRRIDHCDFLRYKSRGPLASLDAARWARVTHVRVEIVRAEIVRWPKQPASAHTPGSWALADSGALTAGSAPIVSLTGRRRGEAGLEKRRRGRQSILELDWSRSCVVSTSIAPLPAPAAHSAAAAHRSRSRRPHSPPPRVGRVLGSGYACPGASSLPFPPLLPRSPLSCSTRRRRSSATTRPHPEAAWRARVARVREVIVRAKKV
ncbi:hypothetical protein DFH06DRAFT_759610 [Mycena polygramma]|nr:hypothetical protein DFH06DRAFT_759610 [Mycena polygramma]